MLTNDQASKVSEGTRIILLANEKEGWVEERGTACGPVDNGTLIVRIDSQYIVDPGDDGLREIATSAVDLEAK